MEVLWIIAAAAVLAVASIAAAYICYRMAFYAPPRETGKADIFEMPEGEIYAPFREQMEQWSRETRALPCEELSVTSFDGLLLKGKFYEYAPGAPIELMFHGYRGRADRDLAGGVQRCFAVGRSALVVDQRCCGGSEGSVITFGIRERRDCLTWLNYMLRRFGPEVKIILTGISMGAATVMMVADQKLPENVMGILADCGYTSPKEIIKTVIRQMGLPDTISYPFVKLGARLFGGFDLEETSPVEALKKSTVPVIFFHGESDDFVPCHMSVENYEACATKKKLVTIPGAGHGLSFPVAPEEYLTALREFFGEEASYK